MINLASVFDSYGRQARLYPGLLTLFPPIVDRHCLVPGADYIQHRSHAPDDRIFMWSSIWSRSRQQDPRKEAREAAIARLGRLADDNLAKACESISSAADPRQISPVSHGERTRVVAAYFRRGEAGSTKFRLGLCVRSEVAPGTLPREGVSTC